MEDEHDTRRNWISL